MASNVFVFFVFAVATTVANTKSAYCRPIEQYPSDGAQPRAHVTRQLRWGAGLRAQTFYANLAWTELGADAVVFPWQHLGLGVTALQGASANEMGCESTVNQPCGPYWRAVTPFTEVRLLPNYWVSPYARGSLGVAWGDFSRFRSRADPVAFAARSELGIDLHYRASLRLYLAAEHFGTTHNTLEGFGGGLQIGLTL